MRLCAISYVQIVLTRLEVPCIGTWITLVSYPDPNARNEVLVSNDMGGGGAGGLSPTIMNNIAGQSD